jgi:hypothetical protein
VVVFGQVEASVPNEGTTGTSFSSSNQIQYGVTPLSVTAMVSLPQGGTIYDTCENSLGLPIGVGGSTLQDIEYSAPYVTAIRLGSLHGTGSLPSAP